MLKRNSIAKCLILAAAMAAAFFAAHEESTLNYESVNLFAYNVSFFTCMLLLFILAGLYFMTTLYEEEETKQAVSVRGKTAAEWEFTDPEIEAMWHRSRYFMERGMETPKGFISTKLWEED